MLTAPEMLSRDSLQHPYEATKAACISVKTYKAQAKGWRAKIRCQETVTYSYFWISCSTQKFKETKAVDQDRPSIMTDQQDRRSSSQKNVTAQEMMLSKRQSTSPTIGTTSWFLG
jgi:hypothetical protein